MTIANGVDADRLRAFIDRIERLEEEKAGISADIKDVYAEARGTGYDVKTMRAIVRLRKIEREDRREQEELLDLYKHALGMLEDMPLGAAAIEREFSPVRTAVRKVQAGRNAPSPADQMDALKSRSKARLSESMADAAALSNAAAAAGLISPESAAETERLTVAIANKLGAGAVHEVTPHDPETGEIEPAPGCMADPSPQDDALAAMLEAARDHVMTDADREAQARSFAYGNAAIDNPLVTRAMVASAPYRVTDPAPAPVAVDPDLSPLVADAAARQAAARRLLGQEAAAE